MQKISVCIIGFNEEKKVENCLQSVQELADEIIYVDSYSTDATVSIVEKYTNQIFYKKFKGHVQQKNFAITKANYNWILSLDCDESLSPKLHKEILKEKEKLDSELFCAYQMKRRTFYIYRWIYHSGWYPDYKIRLFHKDFCNWQGENPHDKIICSNKKIKIISQDILHYSFDSIDDHLKTIRSFSEIAAKEAFMKKKKSSIFIILGRTFWVGFRKIFLEFSFLDRSAGFLITGFSMMATFTKYSKLYVMQKQNQKNKIKETN